MYEEDVRSILYGNTSVKWLMQVNSIYVCHFSLLCVLYRHTTSITVCADMVQSYELRGCAREFRTNSRQGNNQVMFVVGQRTAHVP